jgi:hypothetical protein
MPPGLTSLPSRGETGSAVPSRRAGVSVGVINRACEFPATWLAMLCLFVLMPGALCPAQPGPVICWGNYVGGQYDLAPDGKYLAVCAGGYHSLALTAGQTLAAWGDNLKGQCNAPLGTGFVAVAAGLYHSLALTSDSSIVAWGDNARGQLRVPSGRGFRVIAAGSWHSLGIRTDGALVAWGWNEQGQCNVLPGNNYTRISAGLYHSLALRADGSVVAWGGNGDGQCNTPSGNDFVDIAAGSLHNVALRSDGSLVAWGRCSEGQCRVPTGNDFVSVAAGNLHGLALKRDGSAVAWGPDGYAPCNVPSDERFVAIAAGVFHSIAIRGHRTASPSVHAPEVAAGGSLEGASDATAKTIIFDEAAVAGSRPTPNVGPRRAEAAPTQPRDSLPSLAREPNAPADQPSAGGGSIGAAIQALGVPLAPVAEPNGTADCPRTSGKNQPLLLSGQPSKAPSVGGAHAPSGGADSPAILTAAPVQAPGPKPPTVLKPDVTAGRPGTSSESKAAEVTKQPGAARTVVEPDMLSGRIDIPGPRTAAPAPAPERKPPAVAKPKVMADQTSTMRGAKAASDIFSGDGPFSEPLLWLGRRRDLIALMAAIGCTLCIVVLLFRK